MRQTRILKTACCLLVAAFMMVSAVGAQVTGTIQGLVRDQSGGVLPGVSVVVTNTQTGAERTVQTNTEGFYSAKTLQSGIYTLTASLEGMQTVKRENVQLLTGQTIAVGFELGVGTVTESIVVTAESPLVEVGRSSAASYVSEVEIEELPIVGRDFKDFAFLTPTVQNDPIRGFITMSGQRGIYSGLNVDGTDNKSAFFAYGRGGEATENDGLVVAQDSVKEFQVVTNGFAPEYGQNGGGYINVITKGGTNNLKGSAFLFFRDDSLASDLPASPLDVFDGNPEDTPVDEFERTNFGVTVGGPIKKDRTHFFFSWDQASRDQPFTDDLRTRGAYDAVLLLGQTNPAFLNLIEGYVPNNDGIAAADPLNGRTATGTFLRSTDNTILFGKLDHQFNQAHSGSFRVNLTDYERLSNRADEESEKLEKTTSLVASVVSVLGSNSINEARVQIASDDLDRLSTRVGEPIEAQIRFRGRDGSRSDDLGKFDFLPIFVEEKKLQIQDNFSYLFGNHDLKFGVDYQEDDLSQLFKGSADGRYDFNTIADFLNNDASNVRIFFGNVTNPNYDEIQEVYGIYGQDSFRPNEQLTVSYGFRFGGTKNPSGLEHIFAEGRNIPDDTDNFAPRIGFAYSPGGDGRDVVRGGVGLFYGRTPSLLFASQIQQNGLFPNFGRVNVSPGQTGFVPLGTQINNTNPPAGAPNSPSFVDPSFEDPETWRLNVGYERELQANWSAGVDLVYAEGSNLQSNVDLNRTVTFDQFGRPVNSSTRPDAAFNEIFTRQSIGESEYTAVTLKLNRRYNGRYQFQAHYTWAQDEDTDSNERSATSVTVSDPNNPRYDFGLAERDVKGRFLVSGLVKLPYDFKLSGIVELRSGRPYNPTDADADFVNCGFTSLGFNCPDARPVDASGNVIERNSGRSEGLSRIDLRVSKYFEIGKYQIDLFGEVFNLTDESSFEVGGGFGDDDQRDPTSPTEGLGDVRVLQPRQIQFGARFSFN